VSAPAEPWDEARARATVGAMLASDAFSRWLGVELLALGDGSCSLAMTVRDEMVNGFGVTHGGIAFSLADSAMAFAANQGDTVTVAVDNGASYPAPIHPGDRLVAEAQRERGAGRLAWYHVKVRNQHDAVVCLFRGTVYRTKRQHTS
jgi:acyl-CoA thioesterase